MNAAAAANGAEHCHALGKTGQLIQFYNCFVKKMQERTGKNVLMPNLELTSGDTASLVVVDMQNDFINKPYLPDAVKAGEYPPPYGRFSVAEGESMVNELATFINNNSSKFSKIIFTRDTHTRDHCSFFTNGGPFPPHCIANEQGAALHPTMKTLGEGLGAKADVIFKGCYKNTDSFGAYKYKDAAYRKRRQLGSCCLDGQCENETGGFYLKDATKKWENEPFTFKKCEFDASKPGPDANECVDSTQAEINNQVDTENPFKIEHILPQTMTGTHYIFVLGLAGDYCVKDTAINLSKDIATMGLSNNVKVVIIQPFTRYGFLPIGYVGEKQVYSNINLAGNKSRFTNISKPKDINDYLFKLVNPATGQFVMVEQEEAMFANINDYFAFLTPIEHILIDYESANIHIIESVPDMSALADMAGGRRKRNNRRKATRKQMKRKRQTYRRRR